jgi:hypothetical protein
VASGPLLQLGIGRGYRTTGATLAFAVGNYVSADLENYVSHNGVNLGNEVSYNMAAMWLSDAELTQV